MPRPAASARPTAAGASSASAEGSPTSIHPRAATHVEREGHRCDRPRARCPSQAPSPADDESERADDEEGPSERCRADRPGLEAQDLPERERARTSGGDAREPRPVGTRSGHTERPRHVEHERDDHPSDRDAKRSERPAYATGKDARDDDAERNAEHERGDERCERHRDREHEAQPEHLALPSRPFRTGERSQPARTRQPADHPRHDGIRDEAVEAPVAQRVVRQRDRGVRDERRDARPHRREWLGEPPHAHQTDEEGQQCEQRVQQRHVAERRDGTE